MVIIKEVVKDLLEKSRPDTHQGDRALIELSSCDNLPVSL
jgi:hypothetical protein